MVQRFEELIAWQKSRELTKRIYEITTDGKFARDFGLRDQIRRAAVSIMSNIAEGFERRSPAQFMHFLAISRGSCAEVRSQLFIALDVGYISEAEFKSIMQKAEEVARIVGSLRKSIDPNHE